ncbi:MAG: hypothetical protein A2Z72_03235 [Omnitrophica bacterium RBG_13_46_9]|nr:MAG: hypothetical protein A2Z72_03235 [Omnitrophica bacterium RBG_13_46_9]
MRNIAKILLPVALVSFILVGCGSSVSENKPISEVNKEAQSMSVDKLKATVNKYQAAIQSKKADIDNLTAQIQKIPIKDMLGDEAKKLKADIQNLNNSIRALMERLGIYAQQLRSKM